MGDRVELTRRGFVLAMGGVALGGCSTSLEMPDLGIDTTTTGSIRPKISVDKGITDPDLMYASVQEGTFSLPAIPYAKVPREFQRQIVPDPTGEAPGTIVVKLAEHHLYLVQEGGDALRYGVGIGKAGFEWSGRAVVQHKKQWPVWTPPSEMIARKPELEKWRGGQPGGPENPLGARALYLFKDGNDTGYRIHGSPEWWSIGQNMSSGCIRMINQDVIDLYNRVPPKSTVVVA
ncbi:L,D-transpeptidase [Mesorhizobium sp. J428]|uniref:L,D-transpeptidase n=1 Tax=Mesorhizobium sp. J428 TaxID=2898440 RepID=UPI0021514242|nr:L,D-transpeptidase [Mesorhizobium sp. J428]MCR5859856.1 L,D-transpeptidase [Mesorhizobium sp. J428]